MDILKKAKVFLGLLPIAIILTFLVLSSCSQSSNGQQKRGGGGGNKSAVPVEAMIIHPQLLRNEIFTTGTLLANEEVELRSEISGRVVGVYFEEGKRVNKGELLLKINDTDLQAQLKRKLLEEKLASENEKRQKSLLDIKGISREEIRVELKLPMKLNIGDGHCSAAKKCRHARLKTQHHGQPANKFYHSADPGLRSERRLGM
jgi:multidrug efflux pump subunit AcrA (membrane-fusion protein)